MEINANVTNTVAASISKLNLNTARRSFEKQNQENEDIKNNTKEEENTSINKTSLNNINVEEIQKYAKYMGENLSIDDINYALMYGRSVIADYSV